MSEVQKLNKQIDDYKWQQFEKIAVKHQQVSRLCAIPLACLQFLQSILSAPAAIVEDLYLAAKSIKAIVTAKDPTSAMSHRIELKKQLLDALGNVLFFPVLLLYGVLSSAIVTVFVAIRPVRCAKLFSSERALLDFIREHNIAEISLNPEFQEIDITCPYRISYAAHERFRRELECAPTTKEAAKLHFLDTPELKKRLAQEITTKMDAFTQAKKIYTAESSVLNQQPEANAAVIARLNAIWRYFQLQLMSVRADEVPNLVFKPVAAA